MEEFLSSLKKRDVFKKYYIPTENDVFPSPKILRFGDIVPGCYCLVGSNFEMCYYYLILHIKYLQDKYKNTKPVDSVKEICEFVVNKYTPLLKSPSHLTKNTIISMIDAKLLLDIFHNSCKIY